MDAVRRQLILVLCALGVGAACGDARAGRAPETVDSVRSWAARLERFRAGLPVPARLSGGAPSRETLVRGFVEALERADTAALARAALTRAEFAHLYYPTHPEAHPPYDLDPGLMWFLLEGGSRRGLAAVLAERAGRSLAYAGHRCEEPPVRQGRNRVWQRCVVLRARAPGDTVAERLFALILERDGVYKFVSYANRL